MSKSELHQAALDWSEAGFYVFPIKPGHKAPAFVQDWENTASRDPAQIDVWWQQWPEANVGCALGRSGHCVIDVDPPRGVESLKALEPLPATFTTITPRGGFHYWFKGTVPSTVAKLGPNIDTRSRGGYVLVPPSIIYPDVYDNNPNGGPYVYENEESIQSLPEWVGRTIGDATERHSGIEGHDSPVNIARAEMVLRALVERGDVAIQGTGGDDRTYRLCCEILDLGLSAGKAFELISTIWNPACEPPWDEDQLEAKVNNAAEYRQNEIGAYAVEDPAVAFVHVQCPTGSEQGSEAKSKPSRFRPLTISEAQNLPKPEWLIPGLLPARGFIVIFGAEKSFKSFLTLDIALGLASGKETFSYCQNSMRPVVYVVGEGQENVIHNHIPAWLLGRQVTEEPPLYVVPHMPRAIIEEEMRDLVAQIKARDIKPALLVLDTKSRALPGLDENSSKDVSRFVAAVDHIREELNCAVIAIAHTGKDASRGARGIHSDVAASDGSLCVERHLRSNFVSVTVRTMRGAKEREEPYLFEGKTVGPSLVFYPTTQEAYKDATHEEDLTSREIVGAALERLNAYGDEGAVTVGTLAAEISRVAIGEPEPKKIERKLGAAARSGKPLEAYCVNGRWQLPPKAGQ